VYANGVSGSGIGLGFYGATQVDNFGAGDPVFGEIPEPAPASLVLAGLCGAMLLRLRRRRA